MARTVRNWWLACRKRPVPSRPICVPLYTPYDLKMTCQRLFRKKPTILDLHPKCGEIYGHVFENPAIGVKRDLYWNTRVGFEPVPLNGEESDCSLSIEWLTWPMRRWQDLDGKTLDECPRPEMVGCSFYHFGTHHPASLGHFELGETSPASFVADVSVVAEVNDGSGLRSYQIAGLFNLTFTSIIVVPSNLQPKPSSALEVKAALAEHIALDGLKEPRSEDWRYLLEPTF